MRKVTELAIKLASLKVQTRVLEMQLQEAVNAELKTRGSLREIAKQMGFSAQYLCDVRKGRRGNQPHLFIPYGHAGGGLSGSH